MNTKLFATFAFATSILGGVAQAADSLTLAAVEPTPTCTAIPASKSFYQPLYSETFKGQGFSVGVQGEAKLLADANQLGVQIAFGPAVNIFGAVRRPMDVRLTAGTNSSGINALDLGFYAFGYELDSVPLASSLTPIQYAASHSWSLPNTLNNSWSGSIGCNVRYVLNDCTIGWGIRSSVVANLSSILSLKVSSTGVEGHVMASANANAVLTTTGSLSAILPVDDEPFTATVSGTGVIDFGQAYFATHGTLKPQNGAWVATLDTAYNIEDVLKASAKIGASILGQNRSWTIFSNGGRNMSDSYFYQCGFNKQF